MRHLRAWWRELCLATSENYVVNSHTSLPAFSKGMSAGGRYGWHLDADQALGANQQTDQADDFHRVVGARHIAVDHVDLLLVLGVPLGVVGTADPQLFEEQGQHV